MSTINQSAELVENLIRHSLPETDTQKVYTSVFFENIVFALANDTDLDSAMQIVRLLWLEAFGKYSSHWLFL
jgi:hypothetical protein